MYFGAVRFRHTAQADKNATKRYFYFSFPPKADKNKFLSVCGIIRHASSADKKAF
jgi:hypothetical protein